MGIHWDFEEVLRDDTRPVNTGGIVCGFSEVIKLGISDDKVLSTTLKLQMVSQE